MTRWKGLCSGSSRLGLRHVAAGDGRDALADGRQPPPDGVHNGGRVEGAAGEHVERDQPRLGPRVDARVALSEEHDPRHAVGLELVEASAEDGGAGRAAGLRQAAG